MAVIFMLIAAYAVYYIIEKIYIKYWNKNLFIDVKFASENVYKGDTTYITEIITNAKKLPIPYIQLKYELDKSFIFEQKEENQAVTDKVYRNDIFSLMNYQKVTRKICVKCSKRGVYEIDKINVISTGAFMRDILSVSEKSNAVITVYPESADIDKLNDIFWNVTGMIEKNRYLYEDPFVFRGIRQYQQTDSMKRINWKASARSGSLMVNEYNETSSEEIGIILNVEPEGAIADDKLSEESISIASGLSEKFIEQGIRTSFYSNAVDYFNKEEIRLCAGIGSAQKDSINTALARISLNEPVRKMTDVLEDIKKDEIRNNSKRTYIMISQNARKEIVENFKQINSKESIFIKPYRKNDYQPVKNSDISFIEWEVK